jgi:hypothetical protein
MKQSERLEYMKSLQRELAKAKPGAGGTVEIRWVGGNPRAASGRSDHYEIRLWTIADDGAPECACWLTRIAAHAIGWRYLDASETLSMGGCGFSKTHEIAQSLADACMHPIVAVAPGTFAGPSRVMEPTKHLLRPAKKSA